MKSTYNSEASLPKANLLRAQMLFCTACENLLYPESDEKRSLIWRCRYCDTCERHDENQTVYIINFGKQIARTTEELELLAEFAHDPRAQRDPSKRCPACGKDSAACFVNPLGQPSEDMTLYFACGNFSCRKVWRSQNASN